MLKTLEMKLYLTDVQQRTLSDWLSTCCWLYNHALAQRSKAYKRRKESISYNVQSALLTQMRKRKPCLEAVPYSFANATSLRRVDRAMKAFFRRFKAGQKPGFPRFRSSTRFNSMELIQSGMYIQGLNLLSIPKLGLVRFRGGNRIVPLTQRLLRIIRRASGWYAQVLIDDGKTAQPKKDIKSAIGVDMGISSFMALSNGETISNPRWAARSSRRLCHLQRRVSRRIKGSKNRRKAVHRLRIHHERVAAQRRNFCHKHSTALTQEYDLIAVENLNVSGMSRSRFGKSILDCAWSTFRQQLAYKAECAGCTLVEVNPRYSSQECPNCGVIKPKKLSERIHQCPCGCYGDRDVIAAQVILARARRVSSGETSVEESTSDYDDVYRS